LETRVEPTATSSPAEVLNRAVTNLLDAASFELSVHEIRAYRSIDPQGEIMVIYGEFNRNYKVIRAPALKVHGAGEYRYDPQADFFKYDVYTYQEQGRYFNRLVEASAVGEPEEIDLQLVEPFTADVYQTLAAYSDQAQFISESDGSAVFLIEHPRWYQLQGAQGFANLGFLSGQENGEQLIEQYVAGSYPNVKTIRFTIYVSVAEQLITKVEVDDRDFMDSVWSEVDRALLEQGEKAENLTRYEVMDLNGAEYLFSNYNQVQDFEIPR
jgi:hypothetical protein